MHECKSAGVRFAREQSAKTKLKVLSGRPGAVRAACVVAGLRDESRAPARRCGGHGALRAVIVVVRACRGWMLVYVVSCSGQPGGGADSMNRRVDWAPMMLVGMRRCRRGLLEGSN